MKNRKWTVLKPKPPGVESAALREAARVTPERPKHGFWRLLPRTV